MKTADKELFLKKWRKHFKNAELPLVFYYSNDLHGAELVKKSKANYCIIGMLHKTRRGTSLAFNEDSIACNGGKKFVSFKDDTPPGYEYFLSCGIPGKVPGELIKKTPQAVLKATDYHKPAKMPGKYIIFKRWDMVEESDNPIAAVFFARPDVMSGLFTIAAFEDPDPGNILLPTGAGCSAAIHQPWFQAQSANPKAIVGGFDPAARSYSDKLSLSFAVPIPMLMTMTMNMDESFLTASFWTKIQKRMR